MAAPRAGLSVRAPRDPATLNGDMVASEADVRAYMEYHASRNAARAEESRGVRTVAGPWRASEFAVTPSPQRVSATMFFELAAERALERFGAGPITIIDLGCGRGNVLEPFAARGMRGRYIGIDIARPAKWKDGPLGGFERELVVCDVHRLDGGSLPRAEVVASCTALEHIRDDAGAVRMLASRTLAGGMHAHAMPGAGALPLYGPHGWRQYLPADLEALFPGGTIYRYGGELAHAWHLVSVPRGRKGERPLRERAPALYSLVRELAMGADRELGERLPTMYGVIWEPGDGSRGASRVTGR